YDFPSRSMMAVYQRLRIAPVGSVVRYARVVRWGRRLGRAASNPIARAGAAILGAVADRREPRGARASSGLALEVQAGTCGAEFNQLDGACRGRTRLHLDRSADHLNWRYRSKPGGGYEIVAARDGKGLRGFAVLASGGEDAEIADVSALDDATASALIEESVR